MFRHGVALQVTLDVSVFAPITQRLLQRHTVRIPAKTVETSETSLDTPIGYSGDGVRVGD